MIDFEAIAARAEKVGYPYVLFGGSDSLRGEWCWRHKLPTVHPGHLETIVQQLESHESEAARRAAGDARFDDARARRDAPASEAERAALGQLRIEAAVAHQDSMKPATRGQMNELLDQMRALVTALTKR